eukprot:s2676_g9.t1
MNLSTVASQLRAAQDISNAGLTSASVTQSLQDGAQRARGALTNLAGEARSNLLGWGRSDPAPSAIPSDGTRCESCGEPFGVLRRRQTCGSCDRYLCASCLGSSFAIAGIGCFCGSQCPQCRELGQRSGEFQLIRPKMEAGLFALGDRRKIPAWLSLRIPDLCWASLEQRAGQPLEAAEIPLGQVLHVRNTGLMLELVVKDQPALQLEFGTAEERNAWEKYLGLALEEGLFLPIIG